jgi:hypothetical protein
MEKVEHSWIDGLFVFGPVVLLLIVAIWRDWGRYFDEPSLDWDAPMTDNVWVANHDGSFTNELTNERVG